MKKQLRVFTLLGLMLPLVSCGKEEYFTNWNECKALTTLKEYVKDVTNKKSPNYIPVEDRIATFDMDGTFIGELYKSYFEYNMLEHRVLDDPTYKDIAPEDVKEVAKEIRDFVRDGVKLPDHFDLRHAHAAAKAYAGMSVKDFDTYVKEYAKKTPFGFRGMTYAKSFYKPMLDVFKYLEDNDFTYYVVSGSDRYICRALVDSIGIPSNRVIGMDVALKGTDQKYQDGVDYTYKVTDDLIRTDELLIKNLKTNKVKQISQEIGKIPVLSFGNSSGDSAMHNYCKSNKKYKTETFMLVADDNVRDHADLAEGAKRQKTWEENGYTVISMKNDFKTIYGDGVEMTDFSFPDNHAVSLEKFQEEASKVTSFPYTKATLSVETSSYKTYKDYVKPVEYSENTSFTLEATYNDVTKEWVYESIDPRYLPYYAILDDDASKVSSDLPIFDEDVYQNRDPHYYVDNGFRFRYSGSGDRYIPLTETKIESLSLSGVKAYDTYGLCTYNEFTQIVTPASTGDSDTTYQKVTITYHQ